MRSMLPSSLRPGIGLLGRSRVLGGLGPELVSNPGFDSAAIWQISDPTSGLPWTISDGVAATVDIARTGVTDLYQDLVLENGGVYRCECDLISCNAYGVRVFARTASWSPNGANGISVFAGDVGRITADLTWDGSTGSGLIGFRAGNRAACQIDNVSVRRVS